MRFSTGNGGWVAFDDLGLPGPLFLRMREADGRLRVAEVYLDASQSETSIDPRDLRDLPMSQLEAFVNMHAETVLRRIGAPAPDLSTLASHYSTTFGQVGRQVAQGNWVTASFVAQYLQHDGVKRAVVKGGDYLTDTEAEEALEADPTLPWVAVVPRAGRSKDWVGIREDDREFVLTDGPVDGLSDDFLRDVAKAYTAAMVRGERPNVAIAEQTGFAIKTVQRWVYTARQRGIMPRGSKGRAG